jgi:hypothetical protein
MPRGVDPFAPAPRQRREIPYEFVLERLEMLGLTTKPMFGSHGVYLDERVLFILRRKGDVDDGVWLAFEPEHEPALKALLPGLSKIQRLGNVRAWRKLAANSPSFEDDVLRVCALVLAGDTRIGKLPDRLKAKRKGTLTSRAKPAQTSKARAPRKAPARATKAKRAR